MPKSKSNRRKKKKSKFVQKQKQPWRMSKPTRNWLELPSDLMLNILQRVSVIDRLQNAQKVCTAWREICKDPAMWKVIYMEELTQSLPGENVCKQMCKHAVDRSQGQLLDLTVVRFCDYELLQYVADRSSQLRRLEIVYYNGKICGEPFKKLSLLEELSLVRTNLEVECIEAAGRCCPLLKTVKVYRKPFPLWTHDFFFDHYLHIPNKIAVAIGKSLPELAHLALIGNTLQNIELETILDGCSHLESLDLRRCTGLDLNGDLGKRCCQQIKYLKLPRHSLKGCLSTYYNLDDYSDDGYDGCPDYDAVDVDISDASYDDDVDDDDEYYHDDDYDDYDYDA